MDFSNILVQWYAENKRDLPWRHTKNPYKIWLSEIILQQTRVDQGLSYYLNFINHFPTISDLANATIEDVLKLWQGLGYYSRARNIYFTANEIVKHHKSTFPTNYNELIKMKGIGDYTASAIASFCYNLPHPVIDGNVIRVLSRVFGVIDFIDGAVGKKIIRELATELLDKKNPALYNQAIMEFGAICCKPKLPTCSKCPLQNQCFAFNNSQINELPKKQKLTKQRNRYFNYLVITSNQFILINKRNDKDIWKGLFDFPLIETTSSIEEIANLLKTNYNWTITKSIRISKSPEYVHQLSHQKIYATFWKIENAIDIKIPNSTLLELKNLEQLAVPKLIENYIKTFL